MRETLESIAAVLIIVLQVINMLLSNNVKKKVDELDEQVTRSISPQQQKK